jgi:hypothetical protein
MVTDTRAHADAERCQRQPIAKHGDLLDKVKVGRAARGAFVWGAIWKTRKLIAEIF